MTEREQPFKRAGWKRGKFQLLGGRDPDKMRRHAIEGWLHASGLFALHLATKSATPFGTIDLANVTHLPSGCRIAFAQLANAPHDSIPGLKRRYYYRGNFTLLEALSEKAVTINVARLRRRGEAEHADRLLEAWTAARRAMP